MTAVELRERRERIATAVLAALYARNGSQPAYEPHHVLAFIAIDAADALIEELDKGESE